MKRSNKKQKPIKNNLKQLSLGLKYLREWRDICAYMKGKKHEII